MEKLDNSTRDNTFYTNQTSHFNMSRVKNLRDNDLQTNTRLLR